jgi:hypothetical protein
VFLLAYGSVAEFQRSLEVLTNPFFEGRATFYSATDFYSVDLVAQLSQSDPNPIDWIGVCTYFNLIIPVDTLDLYVGFSPTVIFDGGQLSAAIGAEVRF